MAQKHLCLSSLMSMVQFSSWEFRVFLMTLNSKNVKTDYCGKCLGLPVTNYGPEVTYSCSEADI